MSTVLTDSAHFLFTVKERQDGTPFIMLEPRGDGLPAIGNGFLTLQLREGVPMRQAEEIAQQLNNCVERVNHTRFRG